MNRFRPTPEKSGPPRRSVIGQAVLAVAAGVAASAVHAGPVETDNPDLKIRFDNTVKYSQAYRLQDRSPGLASCAICLNQNDGDNNFGKGLVSNRVDLLSEFDIAYQNVGLRVSGAAWYDAKYRSSNDNNTVTANHVPRNEFPNATRKLLGKKAELLDAFVFGKTSFGDTQATFRLGRHTLLWGESLFYGSNGIAGGQAPIDLVKLLSVPNAQFKETAMPTGKLSGQVQVNEDLSLGGYYQYEWRKTRLMPVGGYLSTSDTMGPGAERIIAGNPALPNPPVFAVLPDQEPKGSGQYGLQLRTRVPSIDTDFGFYATRYHATTPSNIYSTLTGFPPTLHPSTFLWTYAEGIRAYGASFAKAIGEVSLSGEASVRHNAPLSSSGQAILSSIGVNVGLNNNSKPGYAIGETAHAQLSWLASLGPSFISREASFLGEIAWNRITSVTRNASMLNPNADRSATALRMVFSPTYRQLFPGVDVSVPVGVSHTRGRSGAVGPGFGVDRGGDMNLGVSAIYLNGWTLAANYTCFYGPEGPTLDAANNAQFKQALRDRDYLSLSLRNTF
ncbi:DUF1302 domain-containing protein [Telluria mixta]|uniref:DUF1302 domain-containing protein n=1 Tax=Telluria mixta TaxID=34071 RepID=A0ABT2BSB5_9BURK|nr:DUF1302 domain-containing protein [Telluria mixta]MCS0627887.1 DUF1302 domain-containing protein [Telluria mixta]WEM93994.1 DUF1302 domain-containing protein [Telluria mixta]